MTLNPQRTASELAEKIAALSSALPVLRSGRKERLSVYADRSRARPDRPSIVRIHRSLPTERDGMIDAAAPILHRQRPLNVVARRA